MIKTKPDLYRKPKIFSTFERIVAAESTRHVGNLGLYTKDNPGNVKTNRKRFFNELGFDETQVAGAFQVHKDQVLCVTQSGQVESYDALITNKNKLLLTINVADCTPLLIYDPIQKAIAAIHAGWRGTIAQIGPKTIVEMGNYFGTMAENCYAYIGTCIDECSFEVDADVADHFSDAYKRWDIEAQKFFVDLKQANYAQLIALGVPSDQIEVSPYSTVLHNEDYFSYRKEKGVTGRMLGAIGMV